MPALRTPNSGEIYWPFYLTISADYKKRKIAAKGPWRPGEISSGYLGRRLTQKLIQPKMKFFGKMSPFPGRYPHSPGLFPLLAVPGPVLLVGFSGLPGSLGKPAQDFFVITVRAEATSSTMLM
jgi:hypothetical protein